MRIDDSTFRNSRIDRRGAVDSAPRAPSSAQPAAPQDSSDYTVDYDLSQLAASVNSVEEVRAEVVKEVAARLAAQIYDTLDASQRTAEAILRGLE